MVKNKDSADKKTGIGGAFSAFTGAIDEIVNEVKRDLRDMTPPTPDATQQRQKQMEMRAAQMSEVLSSSGSSLAETVTGGYAPPPEHHSQPKGPTTEAKNIATPEGLPSGNLWQHLGHPNYTGRLRADAYYHALTAADVESYARAIANQNTAPFTLGLLAIGLPSLTAEDMHGGGQEALDVLAQTLLKTLDATPRLFGIVGAGPRQLWPDIAALDTFLTQLLNTHRKLIAIGPVGLDEPFAPYTVPQQQAQLALQLELAADFGIPVLLSSRNSHAALQTRLNTALQKLGKLPPLVYTEAVQTPEEMALVQEFGLYVLARPELTAPNFSGRDFYKNVPPEKLLLASGSALVAPHGFAGHFNQPKFMENTLQALAKMRNTNPATLNESLNANLRHLFKL
jgi:TatD DNase family protein